MRLSFLFKFLPECTLQFVTCKFMLIQVECMVHHVVSTLSAQYQHAVSTLSALCQYTVSTLSTHCQHNRHAVSTLSALCQHTVSTLSTHCQHSVSTLSTHCQHSVSTLSARCLHTVSTPSAHSIASLRWRNLSSFHPILIRLIFIFINPLKTKTMLYIFSPYRKDNTVCFHYKGQSIIPV